MISLKIFLLLAGFHLTDGEDTLQKKETRIRFPHFTLVIHDFKGYEINNETESVNRTWFGQFGGGSDQKQAVLNDEEREQENYVETLVAIKDTLALSEFLFDDRINNTLFHLEPQNQSDRFRISYAYLSRLSEVIDHRNYSQDELAGINYDSLLNIAEITPFFPIKDSARYYFRALPHSPDMVEVIVKDGQVVTKEPTTKKEQEWEARQWEKEITRIKKKYALHDTLVVIPGEYDTIATLTRGNKLFGYDYEAFLFRIERLEHNKLAETKYLVVYMAYGC